MKEEIYDELKKLRGLRLTRTTRTSSVECLKFGFKEVIDKEGELNNIGSFGIHLNCNWRFVNDYKILIGSQDLYEPIQEALRMDEPFNWEEPNANLRDITLHELIREHHLVVKEVEVDFYGGFVVFFQSNIRLEVFPSTSRVDKYAEYWRFLDNEKKKHFVICGSGTFWV
ncbi:MAG: hypothetical protein NW226_22070 [Microscillaceae bacterium]|nr:hypothetical protein [Microscillaceae bacterium]